jgi:hypothetical protein
MMRNLAANGTNATEVWYLPGATVDVTVAGDKAYLKITTGQVFEFYTIVEGVWKHPMLVGVLKDTTKKPVLVPLGNVSSASVAYLVPNPDTGKARRDIARITDTNVSDIMFLDVGEYSSYSAGHRQQLQISPVTSDYINYLKMEGIHGGGAAIAIGNQFGDYYVATAVGMPPVLAESGNSITLPAVIANAPNMIPLEDPYTGGHVDVASYLAGISTPNGGYAVLATSAMPFYRFYSNSLPAGAVEIKSNAGYGDIGGAATAEYCYYPPDIYVVAPTGGKSKLPYQNPELFRTHYMSDIVFPTFSSGTYSGIGAVRATRVAGIHLVASQIWTGSSGDIRFACFPVDVHSSQVALTELQPFVFYYSGASELDILSISDTTYIMLVKYPDGWYGLRTQDSGATLVRLVPPTLPAGATKVFSSPWSALDTTPWVAGVSTASKVAVMYTYAIDDKSYVALYVSADVGSTWVQQWARTITNANTTGITDIIPTNTTALGYT